MVTSPSGLRAVPVEGFFDRLGIKARPRKIALLAGIFVALAGAAILAGWIYNLVLLDNHDDPLLMMPPDAAIIFCLLGLSLVSFIFAQKGNRFLLQCSQLGAVIVVLFGLLKLRCYLYGLEYHCAMVGFDDVSGAFIASSSPMTALVYACLGITFLLAGSRRFIHLYQALLVLPGLVVWLGLSRIIFGPDPLWHYGLVTQNSAICFLFITVGIFCLRTDGGLMALLISDSNGGQIARRLLPATAIIPLAIGLIQIKGLQTNQLNIYLFVLADMIGFTVLIWVSALLLNRSDREHRKLEQEIRHLADIVENADDAITSRALDGITLSWNPGAEKLYGYTKEEMVGKPAHVIFPQHSLSQEPYLLAEITQGRTVKNLETIRLTKDQKEIDISATISPLYDTDKKVIGFSVIARDITRRKQMETELQTTNEKFRQLAENINEVFWISEPDNKLIYVSPAYEKIWGRSCESLCAGKHTWAETIHPDDRERALRASIEKSSLGTYDEEYRIVRPDSEVRWIHDRGFIVRNEAGALHRIVGTAEDITARKKVEEQFRQAQKMEGIGQLAGGVAHDFNNILAVIQLQSELLKRTPNLPAKQIEYADEIGATVQRAAALTRQLLLFSRQEVFQPRNLDLSQSITATAKMLQRILGDSVEIIFHLAEQPIFIHADPGMMDQILLNLVVNARDAMPNGGKITIETNSVELDEFAAAQFPQTRTGSFVRLSVIDTGNGIPPEVLPKIFEPFFTTKGVGKGTGLGLATVFGIVQQHQGWINVYSKVGHGTTFRIFLPRLARNTEVKSAHPALEVMHGGTETILLVEDDPTLRASIKSILTQVGYHILEAANGVKALELWQQNRETIHLLLTDLVMPDGLTGKELARRILRENPGLKVIYMSGYSTETNDTDFLLKEGVNFLTKPFQALKLTETIRRKLDADG